MSDMSGRLAAIAWKKRPANCQLSRIYNTRGRNCPPHALTFHQTVKRTQLASKFARGTFTASCWSRHSPASSPAFCSIRMACWHAFTECCEGITNCPTGVNDPSITQLRVSLTTMYCLPSLSSQTNYILPCNISFVSALKARKHEQHRLYTNISLTWYLVYCMI